MLYRYVRQVPLDVGIKYGDILRDGDLKDSTIERFLKSGTLVEVSTPPLSEIPAFEERADELSRAGIITVAELVEADLKAVSRKVKKSVSTLRRWQHEAVKWLTPDITKLPD